MRFQKLFEPRTRPTFNKVKASSFTQKMREVLNASKGPMLTDSEADSSDDAKSFKQLIENAKASLSFKGRYFSNDITGKYMKVIE